MGMGEVILWKLPWLVCEPLAYLEPTAGDYHRRVPEFLGCYKMATHITMLSGRLLIGSRSTDRCWYQYTFI